MTRRESAVKIPLTVGAVAPFKAAWEAAERLTTEAHVSFQHWNRLEVTMPDESEKQPWLPPRWVVRFFWFMHRRLYRVSGGRFGLRRDEADKWGMMQLTTIGRRTGQERSVILGYYEDGPNLVTMAMNGWAPAEPAWWLNLQAHPEVSVVAKDGQRTVRGRAAVGEERERLWNRWREIDKNLDAYAERRPSETAVVILEPVVDSPS